MSLEQDFAEMCRAYMSCREEVLWQQGRLLEVDKLARDYEALLEEMPHAGTPKREALAWETRRMAIQQRARDILHGYECDHETDKLPAHKKKG